MPPAPDRLCADCRLALRPDERCGCDEPRLIRAEAVSSRQQLEALGRRQRIAAVPRRPPSDTGFTFIEKWLGIPLVLALAGAAASTGPIAVLATLGGALFLAGSRYGEIRDNRRRQLRLPPPVLQPRGRVDAALGETVAVAVELRDGHGQPVLRGGFTDGFRIALDDGQRMMVRAGSVVVIGEAPSDGAAIPELEELLAAFPARHRDRSRDPFPRELVRRAMLWGGDQVWIGCSLTEIPDPTAAATGYRDSAATVLSHDAVPELTIDRG